MGPRFKTEPPWRVDKALVAQEGAIVHRYLKLPPRSERPSYTQVLDYYEIVAEVTPETHSERCSRCGLVVLQKKTVAY